MGIVANGATVAQSLMLEYKWPPLLGVASEAGIIWVHQRSTPALICISLVRIMTIYAAHFATQNRMGVGEIKLRPHFQVALETGLRFLSRVENRICGSSRGHVLAPWSVAGFAPDIISICSFGL